MIDLTGIKDKCCAQQHGQCTVMSADIQLECNYRCPFYKPEGCKDWIRIEAKGRVLLYSPEEMQGV